MTMKNLGALKRLLGLKNGGSNPSNQLSNFDNPLLEKWQKFFAELPAPHAKLEVGTYRVMWNKALRSRAGLCKSGDNLVELNPNILIDNKDIEQTLVHELCHLSISRRFWRAQAHGLHWQKLMLHCGFEPKRCHNLANAKVHRQKRHPLTCSCKTHLVSTRLYNRVKKGARYKCLDCQSKLIL